MTRTLFLICLAALVVISSSLTTSLPDELPLLQAYVTNNGDPVLSTVYNGFKIQMGTSSVNNNDTVDVQLALYTSNTFLMKDCGYFASFSCSAYPSCSIPAATPVSQTLPYFEGSGAPINTSVVLDYTYWSLNSSDPIFLDSCSDSASNYGYYTQGLIGLGTGNIKNFKVSPIFSIYLTPAGDSGKLLFRSEPAYINSSFPQVLLATDSNWAINKINNFYVGTFAYAVASETQILFDVNSDAIGLPDDIYIKVITYLSNYGPACSTSAKDQQSCYYTDSISKLPNITISIGYPAKKIILPPQIYIKSSTSNTIYLSFRSLSPSQSGKNYVTLEYQYYIVLGSPLLRYYYTVFDGRLGTNNVILYKSQVPTTPVYTPPTSASTPSGSSVWVIIVIVLVILVIAVGGVLQQIKRRRALLELGLNCVTTPGNTTTIALNPMVPTQPQMQLGVQLQPMPQLYGNNHASIGFN